MFKKYYDYIHFQSIIIAYFCCFIEADNEKPIQSIIIHETLVRVGLDNGMMKLTIQHILKFQS